MVRHPVYDPVVDLVIIGHFGANVYRDQLVLILLKYVLSQLVALRFAFGVEQLDIGVDGGHLQLLPQHRFDHSIAVHGYRNLRFLPFKGRTVYAPMIQRHALGDHGGRRHCGAAVKISSPCGEAVSPLSVSRALTPIA